MPALKPEDVIIRGNSADQEKQNWVSQYRDAYEFALPMRNLYSTFQPGADKMNRVFNSTQIISTQKFASRLQSNLTPPNNEWLDFLPGTNILDQDKDEARRILKEAQKKFFAILGNSNFDTVITEYYLDLAVGTAAMLVMEGDDDNPVIFTAVPNAQLSLDEGPLSSVDGVFRQHTIAARNIETTWNDLTPQGKTKIAQLIAEANKLKKDSKVNILEATYFDFKEKVFYYQVILKGTQDNSNISQPTQVQNLDTGGSTLLVERRLDESPWVITRWIKVAGEVFGRGPLLFALPDIKTLNKTTELMLQNASMAISGLWGVSNDSIANLDMVELSAGTFLPLDRIEDIKRLDIPGDLNVGEAVAEKLENNIRAALFDRALPDPTGAVRSPTEIIQRVRELAQDIGAPFSRIYAELLKPLATRVTNIMVKRGLLEFPLKFNGRAVKVVPTSPLAREQNINDLDSAVQWLQIIQSLGPEVLLGSVKVEDFAQWSAEKLGVDPNLARDEAERANLQEQVAQLLAAAQAAQAGQPEQEESAAQTPA
jgi:hypothetical protein